MPELANDDWSILPMTHRSSCGRGVELSARRARRGTVASMPSSALTPAIKDEIARLGCADIMVGIPSYRNAATIGHVVRAAQAGPRPVLPGPAAGSGQRRRGLPGRHPARRRGDRAARLRRADPARPPDQPAPARQPDLPRSRRHRRQGRRPADALRDGRRARGRGAGRRRLGPAVDRARNGSSCWPARSSRAATTS